MTALLTAVVGAGCAVVLVRAARRAAIGDHVRSIGRRTPWRLPDRVRAPLERALADSAIDARPEEACEMVAACTLGATALTAAVAPGLVPLVVLGAMAAVPGGLRVLRGRARARFDVALPEVLERMAVALRGGVSLGEAIEAQTVSGPVAFDLRRIRARQALGLGLAEAVSIWPEERPLPSVRAAAGALAVASSMGGRSAGAIDGLATSLRARNQATAEARALSAQARLSAVVVGAAPIGYLVLSALVDPGSIDLLVGTGVGRVCLAAGLTLEVLAALWMRRIVGRWT